MHIIYRLIDREVCAFRQDEFRIFMLSYSSLHEDETDEAGDKFIVC